MLHETELKVGELYTNGVNVFELVEAFDPHAKCFRRVRDDYLHYGREFIEYPGGVRHLKIDVMKL